MTTFENVQEIIAEQLGIDKSKVTLEANLVEDLKADSLEIAQLLYLTEEQFNVTLEEKDVRDLKTTGDIVALIDRLSQGKR